VDEPLPAREARALARRILAGGSIVFTKHALQELEKDRKTTQDALNVLRGGAYGEAEWENGGWRHRASTQRMEVVLEFESDEELVVITGWARRA
jgi:hypothetical protein